MSSSDDIVCDNNPFSIIERELHEEQLSENSR